MPVVSHVKSNPLGDFTGTVTVLNSAGVTTTMLASQMVLPSDWNSAHSEFMTFGGNINPVLNGTASGTNLQYFAGPGVMIGGSSNTVQWDLVPASRMVYPPEWASVQTSGAINNSLSINFVNVSQAVSFSRARLYFSVAPNTHTSAATNTWALTAHIGFYTASESTLNSATSGSVTYSGTYSTNSTASLGGLREISIPVDGLMTEGRYWVAVRMSSSSSNASMGYSILLGANRATFHLNPQVFGVATTSQRYLYPGHGIYSVTTSNIPAQIQVSEVNGTGTVASRANFYFEIANVNV